MTTYRAGQRVRILCDDDTELVGFVASTTPTGAQIQVRGVGVTTWVSTTSRGHTITILSEPPPKEGDRVKITYPTGTVVYATLSRYRGSKCLGYHLNEAEYMERVIQPDGSKTRDCEIEILTPGVCTCTHTAGVPHHDDDCPLVNT